MAYILTSEREADPQGSFDRYRRYVEGARDSFPPSALKLATADWYYDATDHRCPHDAWLEAINITEPSFGSRHQERSTSIMVRLFGAYHDGYIELHYPQVFAYSLGASDVESGHRDWLYDEFRVTEARRLIHEIEWRGFDARLSWIIEASDCEYRWLPKSGV
jgi:hypothetical protein